MEYLLLAFSHSQQPLKTRLLKLRHLDSLFFFLLIIALLSFNILQHRQLREEILTHRADHLLDELLQERIPRLERQIQELRNVLSEDNALFQQMLRENKQLTIQLGRELGLPFTQVTQQSEKRGTERGDKEEVRNYEIIEIQPNDEQDSEQRGENSEDTAQSDVIPLEEVITIAEQTCTYMQYLIQAGDSSEHPAWSRPSRQLIWINTSSQTKKEQLQLGHLNRDEIIKVAQGLGKLVLVVMLIAVIIMLTLQKKRKGKHSKSFVRDLWKKVWPQERRRVKEWKQEKDLLVL